MTPLASYDTLIDRVPARDLVWFVYRITRHGHSLRKHLGKTAPSGDTPRALKRGGFLGSPWRPQATCGVSNRTTTAIKRS